MLGKKFFDKLSIGHEYYEVCIGVVSPTYTIRKLIFLGLFKTKGNHFYVTHSQGVTRVGGVSNSQFFYKIEAAKYYIRNEHHNFYNKKIAQLETQLEIAKCEKHKTINDTDITLLDATKYEEQNIQYFKDYNDIERIK